MYSVVYTQSSRPRLDASLISALVKYRLWNKNAQGSKLGAVRAVTAGQPGPDSLACPIELAQFREKQLPICFFVLYYYARSISN